MAFMFNPCNPCCDTEPCLQVWPGPCEGLICTETRGVRTCYTQKIPWSYAMTINVPVPICTENMYAPVSCPDISGEKTVVGNMCSGYFIQAMIPCASTLGSRLEVISDWYDCQDITNPGDFCQETDGYTWPVGTFPSRTRFVFSLNLGCCDTIGTAYDIGFSYLGYFEFQIFDGTNWQYCDSCGNGFSFGPIAITPNPCTNTISYSDANISIVMQLVDTASEDFNPLQECTATWM